MWLKNSEGKRDAMLTMAAAALAAVLIKVMFGGIEIEIAGHSASLGMMDSGTIGAILTPTLGAYVMRRFTDKKYHKAEKSEQDARKKE